MSDYTPGSVTAWWYFALKKMVYSTGTKMSVNTVAKPKPNIIVTAILLKKISGNNGTMPKIVVIAANETGLIRLTAESKIAC